MYCQCGPGQCSAGAALATATRLQLRRDRMSLLNSVLDLRLWFCSEMKIQAFCLFARARLLLIRQEALQQLPVQLATRCSLRLHRKQTTNWTIGSKSLKLVLAASKPTAQVAMLLGSYSRTPWLQPGKQGGSIKSLPFLVSPTHGLKPDLQYQKRREQKCDEKKKKKKKNASPHRQKLRC